MKPDRLRRPETGQDSGADGTTKENSMQRMANGPRALARTGLGVIGASTLTLTLTAMGGSGTPATLPVEAGEMVSASFGGLVGSPTPDPTQFVVTLTDTRVPPLAGNPTPVAGSSWNPPQYNNAPPINPGNAWRARDLGQVFGCVLVTNPDYDEPDIYVTATSVYGDMSPWPFPGGGYGPGGPAGIYRIDGLNGDITNITQTGFGGIGSTQIPNQGPSLGNIAFDQANDVLFVTNLDDGAIYTVDRFGVVLAQWTPWGPGDPIDGNFARLGDRPWAVEVRGDRLYFSIWNRDSGRPGFPWSPFMPVGPPPNPNNSVWSVQISPGGTLVGTPTLEVVLPWLSSGGNGTYSNPVSDIEFGENGNMFVAEHTMAQDYGIIDLGHAARVLEYTGSSGSWTLAPNDWYLGTLINGQFGLPLNCAGGMEVDCNLSVWSGSDLMGSAGYGFQRIPPGGNTAATSISTSWLIPWFAQAKGGMGDTEIWEPNCDPVDPPCDILCEADDIFENEPCGAMFNDGCFANPPAFGDIACGLSVCGATYAQDFTRDQDYFIFTATDANGDGSDRLRIRLQSQFPGVVRLHAIDCSEIAAAESIDCEFGVIDICVPAPAEYLISVTPETLTGGPILNGIPCGSDNSRYRVSLDCIEECDCVEPPSVMSAWYPLDEAGPATSAEVLFNNDATWNGGAFAVPGVVDGALCFQNSPASSSAPNAPELNVGTNDFSIDFWMNRADDDAGTSHIIDKRTGGTVGYSVFLLGGNLAVQISDPANGFFNWVSTVNVAPGEWHFVAVTVDRDDPSGGIIYLDGVPVFVFNPTIRPGDLTNSSPFWMGTSALNPTGSGYAGCLDEVELFQRVLSQDEVMALFAAGPAGKCKDFIPAPKPGDADGDGDVDFNDLIILISSWGPCPPPCPADFNGDGVVDFNDLLILIANWGAC